MKEIKLTQGKVTLVDDDMFDYLNQWKWYYSHDGYAERKVYVNKKYKLLKMHREILGLSGAICTDHINRNTIDNRKENLRIANKSQNGANRSFNKNSLSGIKGVCFDKNRNKWRASIGFQNKWIHIGRYKNIEEAIGAYNNKAIELFGEFAYIN
jgi:hypothetical protein